MDLNETTVLTTGGVLGTTLDRKQVEAVSSRILTERRVRPLHGCRHPLRKK